MRRIALAAAAAALLLAHAQARGACVDGPAQVVRLANIRSTQLGPILPVSVGSGNWSRASAGDGQGNAVRNIGLAVTLEGAPPSARLWIDRDTPSPSPHQLVFHVDRDCSSPAEFLVTADEPGIFRLRASVPGAPNATVFHEVHAAARQPAEIVPRDAGGFARRHAAFASLEAQVVSAEHAPVAGVPVRFVLGPSDPARLEGGALEAVVVTDRLGYARTPLFAGGAPGKFEVDVRVEGLLARKAGPYIVTGDARLRLLQLPPAMGLGPRTVAGRLILEGLSCAYPHGTELFRGTGVTFRIDGRDATVVPLGAPARIDGWNSPEACPVELQIETQVHRLPRGEHVVSAEFSHPYYPPARAEAAFRVEPESSLALASGSVKISTHAVGWSRCPLTASSALPAGAGAVPPPPPGVSFHHGPLELTFACGITSWNGPLLYDTARVLLDFEGGIPEGSALWGLGGAGWQRLDANLERQVAMDITRRHPVDLTPSDWRSMRTVLALGTRPPGAAPNLQGLWWAGPAENGWGMSVSQRDDRLFVGLYVYDSEGAPRWYVMSSGAWDAARRSWSGDLYQPRGSHYRGYAPAAFVVGAPVGHATIDFLDAERARLSYAISGVNGVKEIQRQRFASGETHAPVAGLWWNPSQNGWGLAVAQQADTLFAVWFTYDAAGRTTWFVVPDARFAPFTGRFAGSLYATRGSHWLGAAYDPGRFTATRLGSAELSFGSSLLAASLDDGAGTMRFELTRQPF